jgi:hypothetical protein
MQSGTWRIIVQGSQIAVQRIITVTVGVPQAVVTTVSDHSTPSHAGFRSADITKVTPTVVLGITSTPKAQSKAMKTNLSSISVR